jgi:hypothetical protein
MIKPRIKSTDKSRLEEVDGACKEFMKMNFE